MSKPPECIIRYAIEASQESPCLSKRGAAIFRDENLISVTCNRKPPGFECSGDSKCKATCRYEAVHAEQAALLWVPSHRAYTSDMLHVKTVDGALVPSRPPSCVECSKLILAAGIRHMWLYHADGWRRYEASDFHRLSLENTGRRP